MAYGFMGLWEKGIVEGIADSGCSESGFNVKGLFVYAFEGEKKEIEEVRQWRERWRWLGKIANTWWQWGGFNINGFMDLRRKEEIEWGKAFQGD